MCVIESRSHAEGGGIGRPVKSPFKYVHVNLDGFTRIDSHGMHQQPVLNFNLVGGNGTSVPALAFASTDAYLCRFPEQ